MTTTTTNPTPLAPPSPTTQSSLPGLGAEAGEQAARQDTIDLLNSLLRGELSAVETYDMALDKFSDTPQAAALKTIQNEHQRSAVTLRDRVLTLGGTPDQQSGSWGMFAQAVQSTANLFGEGAALSSLRRGEQHGESEYVKALANPALSTDIEALIRAELLPRIRENVLALGAIKEIV